MAMVDGAQTTRGCLVKPVRRLGAPKDDGSDGEVKGGILNSRAGETELSRMLKLLGLAVAYTSLLTGFALPQSQAFASGGDTIATAPSVTYGKQLFGNTATDGHGITPTSCATAASWWSLPTSAGDQITIDFEGDLDYLAAWPVGTTDFNIHSSSALKESEVGENDRQEAIFTTPVGGVVPLEFYIAEGGLGCGNNNHEPGPYDFTASVRHALVAGLTPVTSIYTKSIVTGTAYLADGTPAPDGLIFHLVAKWHNSGKLIRATYSAATASGALSFQLALPPKIVGKTTRVAISRAEDASYQAAKSVPLNVKVAGRKVPAHRHRHHHHHRHRHHHHRH